METGGTMVEHRSRVDAFGWLAYLVYVGVGGFFVFAFAWALHGAVEVQNAAICRALHPEPRAHVVATVRMATGQAPPSKLALEVDGQAVPSVQGQEAHAFVPEGAHRLRFTAEGAAPVEVDVTVTAGEEVQLDVQMTDPAGVGQGTIAARGPWLAPDLQLQDLEGRAVRLTDYRGKFVVLNFWATWCEPCIGEWPQVHQLAERLLGRDDVVVLAVSIDDDASAIRPFLERMSLGETPVQVLWDPTQSVHRSLGTEKIPDTYFIDAEGHVKYAFVNVRKWGSPEAYHCVDGSVR